METLKQIEEKVKLFIDAANQKIDPEIFKLIIGLQAHNIPTQFSCAGHADREGSYPYVDIYADDSKIDFEDFSEPMIEKKAAWIQENVFILKQLEQLLSQFYSNHKAEYKYMITPHCSIDLVQIRLKSIGADLVKRMSKTEFKKELEELQKEMVAFSTFLIEEYRRL